MKHIYAYCWKCLTLVLVLCISPFVQAQNESFTITWPLNGIKSGFSSSTNFYTQDALIADSISTQGFVTVSDTSQALVTRGWPTDLRDDMYLEFEFTPTTFEYNLTSLNAILKRSANGPKKVLVSMIITKYKSFEDSTSFVLDTLDLSTEDYTPVSIDLSNRLNQYSTYMFRFYAFGATALNEDLLVDQVIVNGERTAEVLPVELIYLKAQPIGNQVELSWETAWERNSKEFIVQRSHDLREFGDIGRIAASGQTQGRQQYSFVDTAPVPGTSYYRLRSVDLDNTYQYSDPVDVIYRPDQPQLLVSPNPVTEGTIRIRAFGIRDTSLRLTSLTGQAIPIGLHKINADVWEIRPRTPLPTGVYLLSGNQESIPLTVKVLVY